MDIVKVFAENNETAEINIQGTFENPLFQANQIGKLLGIKNIRQNIETFDDDEKVVSLTYTLGGNQTVTFLTEIGLYRLLGMSRKPVARKFNKWVATVIKEIRITGKYKLEGEFKATIEKNRLEFELKQSKTLIEKCHKKSGVYIAKIKEVSSDNIIIKIGSSEDILTRSKKLRNDFCEFIVLDFFEAAECKAYETALHNHPFIDQYKYNEQVNGVISTEIFLINRNIYSNIVNIAINKQSDYFNINQNKLLEILENKKEIKQIQLEKINKELELKNNDSDLFFELKCKDALEKELASITISETKNIIIKETKEVPIKIEYKDRYNNRGNKIQKYTPDGKLVCTYQSNMDTIRKEPNTSVAGLKKAIHDEMLYKNHRWMFLDREKADNFIQDIGETKKGVRSCQQGSLIAMLDIDKNFIIKVYPDQLSAAEERHLARASICSAIKRESLSSGHYFMYYDECSDEMKQTYISHSKLPDKPVRNNAKVIKQLHPVTKEVLNTYNSMALVQKEFQLSLTTLRKAIDNNELVKNFRWSY